MFGTDIDKNRKNLNFDCFDRFTNDNGMYEITINDNRKLMVEGEKSLFETLRDRKIFIPSACGGQGLCGLCKVKILEDAGPISPAEEHYLTPEEKTGGVRLSCRINAGSDLKIEVPQVLLDIRQYACICVQIRDLTYDIKQFRFELIDPPTLDYVPGQYVQLLAPAYGKSVEEVSRAYSISSDPAEKGVIELIIRRVPGGICTTYCFDYLKEGDKVEINGPYGELRLSNTEAPIIFIAGGSGMAPIKCILHYMKDIGCTRSAAYYFGGNQVRDLFLLERMRRFERELPDFRFIPVVAKPEQGAKWSGETGLVTEAVQRNAKNIAEAEAYLCGSPGMIDASIKTLTDLGMPQKKIFYDKFA